ncbi:MAG: GatB/YqeY domain-containing protein [Actinomycetia bacterium]|nr:GatB/YqeY domain-containing protein [Actinomycetes bacterium]MCP4225082.1 GatB/YqeY domain-containing protein [Actinomycetes bacterium]MCP5031714.1 GatB/YqeY domain-containing protein [Actinomycetes bacterium]
MLIETIRQDLTKAMKARDELRLRTLRAVIAAVQEAQVSGAEARQLDDDEVERIISSQVKRRVEAAAAFTDGARPEMAEAELAEKAVLEEYLPASLSIEELESIVDTTLTKGGWTAKADMGQAMKAINAEVAGRADGKTIAELVKARLS